ncbi:MULTISPECIES: aromatic acid exporter family protein [Micromonospora]|uniref:Aromatic acid exporter family protein n=1 Tax=Micromonospora solifontis TaxID=2487138 RepID=A0ABX9WFA0_9ACTN|nr:MULTISPECIES: FUSC family protein [Micromonospora]NES13566.1 aromatic acid exporter family protein [Micromonospora sp. PPF5-17B]NES37268.1 aromatic acid exporter family protein [Micromonospora solifontis]NES55468.1 aromatic acid exporter family protein [Micromonospora sp. PPF5-6]RNL98502.1 aromatic acid exporter family protein [Micromonospora solifontis]
MREARARWGHRVRDTGRDTYRRLRTYLIVAVQAGLAATLAWVAARELLGSAEPTFAPAAAVGVIAASLGHRARRTAELVVGVVLGITVGDLLIAAVGTGPWQTGVIVFLAVTAAVLVRGPSALVTQAGGTAVLVATLTPTAPDLELPRTVNALVGGIVGLLVVLVLAPLNPLRTVRRVADPALDVFARDLTASAEALARRDARAAEEVLDRMRAAEPELDRLGEVVNAAEEVVRLSPVRWRRRRVLAAYRSGVEHMDRAFRNSRALVRRIGTTLRDEEPVPAGLPAAVAQVAEAVRLLHREFLAAREPVRARARVLDAVREAGRACRQDVGFSGTIVVSQLRTVANDLLRATGVPRDEARRLVRRAAAGR